MFELIESRWQPPKECGSSICCLHHGQMVHTVLGQFETSAEAITYLYKFRKNVNNLTTTRFYSGPIHFEILEKGTDGYFGRRD